MRDWEKSAAGVKSVMEHAIRKTGLDRVKETGPERNKGIRRTTLILQLKKVLPFSAELKYPLRVRLLNIMVFKLNCLNYKF